MLPRLVQLQLTFNVLSCAETCSFLPASKLACNSDNDCWRDMLVDNSTRLGYLRQFDGTDREASLSYLVTLLVYAGPNEPYKRCKYRRGMSSQPSRPLVGNDEACRLG